MITFLMTVREGQIILTSMDSLLEAATCMYLAHKTEEWSLFTAARKAVVKDKFNFAFPEDQFYM